jgi:hypothetical protein
VLDAASTYTDQKDPGTKAHWRAIYQNDKGDGRVPDSVKAAMLHELLHVDLSGFNIREIPVTAAKIDQQERGLDSVNRWLFENLTDRRIGMHEWGSDGALLQKDEAHSIYCAFSKQNREYPPAGKDQWARQIYKALGSAVCDRRIRNGCTRDWYFQFAPLWQCRSAFNERTGLNIAWEAQQVRLLGWTCR